MLASGLDTKQGRAGESEEFLEARTPLASHWSARHRARVLIGREVWAHQGLELLGRLPRIADDEIR